MEVFIALYRGVNVGGKNSVKMESLRKLHEQLGHRQVKSYIQSGNIVFKAIGEADDFARILESEFDSEFGIAAKVIVVSAKRWAGIVKDNPYSSATAEKPQTVHVGLCEGQPDANGLNALLTKTGGSEEFAIKKRVIYLHAPDGLGRSKFAAGMERACASKMTARNWRTVEMLLQLTKED